MKSEVARASDPVFKRGAFLPPWLTQELVSAQASCGRYQDAECASKPSRLVFDPKRYQSGFVPGFGTISG